MVTEYTIPCSCGCGVVIRRKIFATGACKVRAFRDGKKQEMKIDEGEVLIPGPVTNGYKTVTKGVTNGYKSRPTGYASPVTDGYKEPVTNGYTEGVGYIDNPEEALKIVKEKIKKTKKLRKEVKKEFEGNFCEHGSMKGLCKYGC